MSLDSIISAVPKDVQGYCTLLVGFVAARFAFRILSAIYAHTLRPGKNLKKYGDWAVVTGATDGIGQAIAFECARKGLNVLLLSRTEAKLQATENALAEKYPKVTAEHLAVDYSNFDSKAQAAVAQALEGKAVAVLVNNVGMSYPYCQYFHELSQSELDAMVELNVTSTSRMTYLTLPGMLARKKGLVVNMSSAAAQNPSPLLSQYAGTKGYVEHLTASLHKEYASKGIHFQVQSPLFVTTKLAKIKRASLTVPNPEGFARASVKSMGYELQTSPFWAHALQLAVMGALPSALLDKVVMSMHLGIRKAGQKKEAKLAAEKAKAN